MSSEQEAMSFEAEGLYVSESERQGWSSIARIWIGNGFNVSTLITGAALGAGLTLFDSFLAAFIGFGIIVAYNRSRHRTGASPICGKFGSLPFQIFIVVFTLLSSVGALLPVT